MFVVAQKIELRIRGAGSLKEKRHIVKSVIAHLSSRFGLAVAEVDDLDKWQKATLGVAGVANELGHLDRVLHQVARHLEGRDDVEVLRIATEHMESPA